MTPDLFLRVAINPALELLPEKMNSLEAKAMMIAIALQESGLVYRKQFGGPARSFFQFESGGGIHGVLSHPATAGIIGRVLDYMGYDHMPDTSYYAIEHNDVLACIYARLLLWTDPAFLPDENEADKGWDCYQRNWRPGRPRPDDWPSNFSAAWEEVRRS
jgi:hypothetical protein